MLPDGAAGLVETAADITRVKLAPNRPPSRAAASCALLNALPNPVFVKDRKHRWVLVNDAYCQSVFNGRSPEEIVGRCDEDFFDDVAAVRQVYEQDDAAFASSTPIVIEDALRTTEGVEPGTYFHKSKRSFRLPDGSEFVVGSMTDITATRQISLDLERSQQFLRVVLDSIPQPVFVKDEQHRWVIVNEAFCQIFGRQPEEILGRTDKDVTTPDWAAISFDQDDQALRSPTPLTWESNLKIFDGTDRWMNRTKRGVTLQDGTRYVIGVNIDITDAKRAAVDAEKSRRFVEAILNAIPSPVFVKDRQHRFVLVNDAVGQATGQTPVAAIGNTLGEQTPPDRFAAYMKEDEAVFAADQPMFFHDVRTSEDGRTTAWYKSKCAITLPDGSEYLVGVMTDVTQLQEAQNALARNESRLNALNAIAGAMARGAALDDVLTAAVEGLAVCFPFARVSYMQVEVGRVLKVPFSSSRGALRPLSG
ncbi:MAG: PAS domain-containing protein, partial [Phycisphaerales bacterium]